MILHAHHTCEAILEVFDAALVMSTGMRSVMPTSPCVIQRDLSQAGVVIKGSFSVEAADGTKTVKAGGA